MTPGERQHGQPGQPVDWQPREQQQLDPPELNAITQRLDRELEYAVRSRTHLWIATMLHRASDKLLDAYEAGPDPTDPAILDRDTMLLAPMVGCFVCEQAYSPRLRRRRCPGEPK